MLPVFSAGFSASEPSDGGGNVSGIRRVEFSRLVAEEAESLKTTQPRRMPMQNERGMSVNFIELWLERISLCPACKLYSLIWEKNGCNFIYGEARVRPRPSALLRAEGLAETAPHETGEAFQTFVRREDTPALP